jgi:iron complex transport system substrate-binding protein
MVALSQPPKPYPALWWQTARRVALRLLALGGLALGVLSAEVAAETRVVSQSVGTDELLLALAGPGQIAALSHLATDANFSAAAAEVLAAGHARITSGDAETILRHRPTLVLFTDYSRAELVAQVRRADVRTWTFDRYATLADAHAALRALAAELGGGAAERAERIIKADTVRVAELERRLAGRPRVAALAPTTYGVLAGSGTTFDDLCARAGADNLAASLGSLKGFARLPAEAMLTWPVEVFVVGGESDEFQRMPPYPQMMARRPIRVVRLDAWMLGCVTHRRVDAYEALARALHPEVFRE